MPFGEAKQEKKKGKEERKRLVEEMKETEETDGIRYCFGGIVA